MRLDGKVALVTGGSSGIGRATALAFASAGARVAIGDVDVVGGEETVRMVNEAGGEATFMRTDVSKGTEVESFVEGAVGRFASLDCAFNNAGVDNLHFAVGELSEEEWDRVIDINLKGMMFCLRYEIPRMLALGGGRLDWQSSMIDG